MDINLFFEKIKNADRIGISGHLRPDGDCIGSCLGLANYILDNFGKFPDIFLQEIPECFGFLSNSDRVIYDYPEKDKYDLFIALDCGSIDRLGDAQKYFDNASYTFCIDHHGTNTGYADENIIVPEASATSELLCTFFEADKINKAAAECLFLGIVHDTGVFKHSNTTRTTFECAGMLIDKGVVPGYIIDKTFYEKTYIQNQILGRSLLESILLMDGRVIASYVSLETQKLYGIVNSDMEGIIDQLRVTKDVEVAILLKEVEKREWKVSLRSNYIVDVSKIAVKFGGGGHIRASGCTMHGSVYDVYNTLTREIEQQMN